MAICLQQAWGYTAAVAIAVPYYLLMNSLTSVKAIRLPEGDQVSDPFLLALSKNLLHMEPERAFLEAQRTSAPEDALARSVISLVREGCPLRLALQEVATTSETDARILRSLSALLSISSYEASARIRAYVEYRRARRRRTEDLLAKLKTLSLRLRVLSIVGSASLAVVAFSSPLISALGRAGGHAAPGTISDLLRFNPSVFSALLSVAALSTYLASKASPFDSGGRLAAASAITYLCTYLVLVLVIGWSV